MADTILILPGDGIGPEVTAQAVRVLQAVAPDVQVETGRIGGESLDAHGVPLTPETLAQAKASRAVLMGAVGGPQWAGVARHLRPEMGLLALRKGLDTYANLRPARCFAALAEASSLKPDRVAGLDILIVRELTSGVYFGEPRGTDTAGPGGERRGYDTAIYLESEVRRVARIAFDMARVRGGRVCSVDKANVMESGLFWRTIVTEEHARSGTGVALSHMYADACAMELVRKPTQFDVILADNLFGDLLSDEAAMLTGSIGMLPSAAIGDPGHPGLYEPVHGSAPDIAGQGIANPLAAILSLEMALRHSLHRTDAADRIARAVETALDQGARTRDIGGTLGTEAMGDAVLAAL